MSKTLDQLTAGLKQLDTVDAVWRQHNSFAKNAKGELIAFSLSGSKVDSIVLDDKAAALEYLYLGGNEGQGKRIITPVFSCGSYQTSHTFSFFG